MSVTGNLAVLAPSLLCCSFFSMEWSFTFVFSSFKSVPAIFKPRLAGILSLLYLLYFICYSKLWPALLSLMVHSSLVYMRIVELSPSFSLEDKFVIWKLCTLVYCQQVERQLQTYFQTPIYFIYIVQELETERLCRSYVIPYYWYTDSLFTLFSGSPINAFKFNDKDIYPFWVTCIHK